MVNKNLFHTSRGPKGDAMTGAGSMKEGTELILVIILALVGVGIYAWLFV